MLDYAPNRPATQFRFGRSTLIFVSREGSSEVQELDADRFWRFHTYGTDGILVIMKEEPVRTTVDIPAPLYRKLKQRAARESISMRQVVTSGVQKLLAEEKPLRRRAQLPLIRSKGPKVNLTNETIYSHIEFP